MELATRPVGPQLLVDDADVLERDGDRIARLARADVAREEALFELGIEDGKAPGRPGAPDDQVVLADVDGHVVEDVRQGLAPAQHRGLPLALLERLGEETRPVEIQPDRLLAEPLEHAVDAGPALARLLGDEPDGLAALDPFLLG